MKTEPEQARRDYWRKLAEKSAASTARRAERETRHERANRSAEDIRAAMFHEHGTGWCPSDDRLNELRVTFNQETKRPKESPLRDLFDHFTNASATALIAANDCTMSPRGLKPYNPAHTAAGTETNADREALRRAELDAQLQRFRPDVAEQLGCSLFDAPPERLANAGFTRNRRTGALELEIGEGASGYWKSRGRTVGVSPLKCERGFWDSLGMPHDHQAFYNGCGARIVAYPSKSTRELRHHGWDPTRTVTGDPRARLSISAQHVRAVWGGDTFPTKAAISRDIKQCAEAISPELLRKGATPGISTALLLREGEGGLGGAEGWHDIKPRGGVAPPSVAAKDRAKDDLNPEHGAIGRAGATDLINSIPGLSELERLALAVVAGIVEADTLLADLDEAADLMALEASALEKARGALIG